MTRLKILIEGAIIATIAIIVTLVCIWIGSAFLAIPVLGFLLLFYAYTADPTWGCSIEAMAADLRDCEETAERLRTAIQEAQQLRDLN